MKKGEIMKTAKELNGKSYLEQLSIGEASTAEQYCSAIKQFVSGKIDELAMWNIISSRRFLDHH
jgi:hypothetical protein